MCPEHLMTAATLLTAEMYWKYLGNKLRRSAAAPADTATGDETSGLLGFIDLMRALHSCPASSAGIERWFSTIGFVWSEVRNRLGVEKAKKLSFCYRMLKE